MKKLLSFTILLSLAVGALLAQTPPARQCSVVITGDFDSECLYDYKNDITDEYPNLMVACKGSTVTYTAHADLGAATASGYVWQVSGDVSHTANGDQVTVEWGTDTWGYVVVAVADGQGDTCIETVRVRLIDNPTVGSVSVPPYTTRPDGSKVIYVCKGGTVEFLDRSTAEGSDIAGYMWKFTRNDQTSTPDFVLENINRNGTVTHRVYNNCGCYDEETYEIELLKGDVLELDCYGTVCKNATVTYTALNPACHDYSWYVEGGTILDGQGTAQPTVLWDHPVDGYGVIGLDGVVCGGLVCPTLMSLKVPVIHDSLSIEGQTTVCEGEAVLFSLPLFGSTGYRWSISPTTGVDTSLKSLANEMRLVFNQAGTYTLECSYRCDFLGCGPYAARPLTITVKPPLTIEGPDRICVSNACSLAVTPAVSAAWTAYDLANGNAVAATGTGTTFSHIFSHAGRYLVTAEHPDYCCGPSFVLDVRPTPPAPTVADLDPANRHTACLYSGAALAGTPSQPNYMLVWHPACTTATPQTYSGDSVTISYLGEVCDVHVYNYDMVLQCQSADYYVHTMEEFEPAPMHIPANITACPGTVITWGDAEVPDQSDEGMLYRWSLEYNKQYCASAQGSQLHSGVTLVINEIQTPVTFTVNLERRYCGNIHADTVIPITVTNIAGITPMIAGPDTVCIHTNATYTGSGGNPSTYRWSIEGSHYNGTSATHSFDREGNVTVTLSSSPYTYCTVEGHRVQGHKTVHVNPQPLLQGLYLDRSTRDLCVEPQLNTTDYSFVWRYTQDYGMPQAIVPCSTACYHPGNNMSASGTYTCIVTDNATGCSASVSTFYEGGPLTLPCDTMHFTSQYDYCTRTLSLTAVEHPSVVYWNAPDGDIVSTGGQHYSEVEVQFNDVGIHTVEARSGFGPCYEGLYAMTVDFIPEFTFVPQCNSIRVDNNSRFLRPAKTVYIQVIDENDVPVGTITMSASSSSALFTPTPTPPAPTTYRFYLTGYGTNGSIPTPGCLLGTATIGMPQVPQGVSPVDITTSNPANPSNRTCDNTPIRLTANINYPGSIVSTFWTFGDGSSYHTASGAVSHTFKAQQSSYNVSVAVADNYGCTSLMTAPFVINSSSDALYNGQLIKMLGSNECPNGNPKDIYFDLLASNNQYEFWRHKDLTRRPSVSNIYHTYRTDDYFVYVINYDYCQREASTNVAFLNAPTATIYADNFNCCEGDELTLYGQQGPSSNNITYSWVITDANNNVLQTSTEPNITFTAPQGTGTYTVTLTVTDQSSTCSSTATETVTVHAKPAAPTIAFSGSPCISEPPVRLAATGFTGEMHWSNGSTEATADYYTHGMAEAYYYDPSIGCASDTATIRIDRQPDFEALLTGCYKKCNAFFNYYLPVWGLTDDSQIIGWEWKRDGNSVATGSGDYYHAPLWLPLQGLGSYSLDVTYGGGNCSETSPALTIDNKEFCDCDSMEVSYERTQSMEGCALIYDVDVTICNHHNNRVFCTDDLQLTLHDHNVSIVNTDFTNTTIAPNDCYTFSVRLKVVSLEPSVANFMLTDMLCQECELTFSVDLMPEIDCEKTMVLGQLQVDRSLSSSAAAYFDFVCDVGAVGNVLAFWTEPPMVIDWHYSGTGTVTGLGMVDMARLSQLVYEKSEVCFLAIVCNDGQLCRLTVCINAKDLLGLIVDAGVTPRAKGGGKENEMSSADPTMPSLMPNPTTGKVTVTGASGEVVEVVVMDMNGRKLAVFTDTEVFDIQSMPAGSYIIRIRTKNGDVTYHKLIKQ